MKEAEEGSSVGTLKKLMDQITVIIRREDIRTQYHDVLDSYQPDIVLVDSSIPEKTREESIENIRSLQPSTPVVILASPSEEGSVKQLLNLCNLEIAKRRKREAVEEYSVDTKPKQSVGKTKSPTNAGRSILVVDDSPEDRYLIKRALRKVLSTSYSLVEADTGDDGLSLLAMHKVDCMLLDYSLPRRNGLDVLGTVRDQYPNLPVVFLTGQGNEDVAVKALKLGAQDYILKTTITADILHQTILNACARQALVEKVRAQNDALTVFTRAMAHDLKEPLRTCSSFMSLLDEAAELSSEHREYIQIVKTAAGHMERLVDMVHDYTTLEEEEGVTPAPKACEGSKVVDLALNNLSKQLREIENEIIVDNLPALEISETQCVSLFQNVISNALNFGDKDVTKIWISCSIKSPHCIISIKDNGPGIPKHLLSRIFLPFKRLSNGARKGTGLGLSICKKIVQKHGGEMWVDSDENEGTVFSFSLPLASDFMEPESPVFSVGIRASKSQRIANVLHVDDNPNDLLLTRMMLEKLDHLELNIINVNGGVEALDYLTKNTEAPVDLILLDINMPVMDGFEFLERLNETAEISDIPVIVCSTSSDERDQVNSKKLGARGYITKPVRLANLEPTIEFIDTIELREDNERFRLLAESESN